MKPLYVLFLLFFYSSTIAQPVTTPMSPELEKVAASIRAEGLLLYRSERASWLGTDYFMEQYLGTRESIGGYFSYFSGDTTTCVFYSKEEPLQIIGTVHFEDILHIPNYRVDLTKREFTKTEREYYALRKAAQTSMKADTIFRYYEHCNVNLVCVIDEKRKDVYVLTATSGLSTVIFGNDYLIQFDKLLKHISTRRLHMALIPLHYPPENKDQAGIIHTHLPEFSPFITPTDICTAMLYTEIAQNRIFTTVSHDYFCHFDAATTELHIFPLPPREQKDK